MNIKTFPVLDSDGKAIPYDLVKKHEKQVTINHGQTIDRLIERGGLNYLELYAVLRNEEFNAVIPEEKAKQCVNYMVDFYVNNLINETIEAKKLGLRPCIISDVVVEGKRITDMPAYFHRWIEDEGKTYALLELADGYVVSSLPAYIKFTDR